MSNVKVVETLPETQEDLESWYSDLKGLNVPITAVQSYTYVVTDEDLELWLPEAFPNREEEFYEALGVNTRILEGIYLFDIYDAVRRMNGQTVEWD